LTVTVERVAGRVLTPHTLESNYGLRLTGNVPRTPQGAKLTSGAGDMDGAARRRNVATGDGRRATRLTALFARHVGFAAVCLR
jgi:hypothetical protein